MKRTMAIFITLLMACTLTANAAPEGTVDFSGKEPIEFTYFSLDPNFKAPYDENVIAENIFARTGVRIKFVVPPTEGAEKLNTMLASDDTLPDLIELNNAPVGEKLAEAGKLLPLQDLLEEHGPMMLRNYGDRYSTMKSADGNVYQLPAWYPIEGIQLYPETRNGFNIRTGFLEKNSWYQPKTYEDYYKLLKQYKEEDGSMIPVSLALADERTMTDLIHIANAAAGGTGNEDIVLKDGMLAYARTAPEVKDLFRLLNRLYSEGLMDQEALVMKTDMLKNKLAGGQVFSTIGEATQLVWDANRVFEDAQTGDRFDWFFLKRDDSLKDDDRTYARYVGSLSGGVAISKDCKDPVRLIQFLNFMATEEGFMTLNGNYDFEGKNDGTPNIDWYIDVNKTQRASVNGNEVYITDWLNDQLGSNVNVQEERGLWKYGWMTYIGCNPPDYKYDWTAMEMDSSVWWTETERKINEGFGRNGLDYFPDLQKISVDVTDIAGLVVAPESDAGVIYTRVTDYYNKQIVKCIAAPADQYDAQYDQLMEQIRAMGIEQWEAEINRLYTERLALWSE